jgi:hypothetical protein
VNAAVTDWRGEIDRAAHRLEARAGHFLRETPLWKLPAFALDLKLADGVEVWLKLEHLQTGGSFKARGMFNRLRAQPLPAAGVVIASGGNAGIAAAGGDANGAAMGGNDMAGDETGGGASGAAASGAAIASGAGLVGSGAFGVGRSAAWRASVQNAGDRHRRLGRAHVP